MHALLAAGKQVERKDEVAVCERSRRKRLQIAGVLSPSDVAMVGKHRQLIQ